MTIFQSYHTAELMMIVCLVPDKNAYLDLPHYADPIRPDVTLNATTETANVILIDGGDQVW